MVDFDATKYIDQFQFEPPDDIDVFCRVSPTCDLVPEPVYNTNNYYTNK